MIGVLMRLASLCLRFGRVNRATRHEDGVRFETDTDHTVMLGVVACAYAARFAPHLDRGKIAQFSMVHDLVEAYSGDVQSLGMGAAARASKEEAERAALARIRAEFMDLPWIAETIDEYESLRSEEARFVKIVDKVLPKLTHLLNDGAALKHFGFTFEKTHAEHVRQFGMMRAEYPQADALDLFEQTIAHCVAVWGIDR